MPSSAKLPKSLIQLNSNSVPEMLDPKIHGVLTIEEILNNPEVVAVDIACGFGRAMTEAALKYPASFIGLDLNLSIENDSNSVLTKRIENLPKNLALVQGNWSNLPIKTNSTDVIFNVEGAGAWLRTDAAQVASELTRIAKPGCVIYGTERAKDGTKNYVEVVANTILNDELTRLGLTKYLFYTGDIDVDKFNVYFPVWVYNV
ncbi:MAG: class I SAM-dependent methyltransferase [Candidatus Dojkabacteria bacterium]|nr:class I SAM-dependent methyltransferase [Candidatus Dojkabacteria bacterium]